MEHHKTRTVNPKTVKKTKQVTFITQNQTISNPQQVAQQINKFFISLGGRTPKLLDNHHLLMIKISKAHYIISHSTSKTSLVQTNKQN